MATTGELLEREWKKERDRSVERVLTDAYLESGRDPQVEFARLKEEVEHEVRRALVEEISGELGNLEREPWRVHVLTEDDSIPVGAVDTDYVTPDGVELWVRTANTQRPFVMDYPLEYLQRELEREYGYDAQFVTVFDGGTAEYLADAKTDELYRLVRDGQMGERECPFATWDPEAHEEGRDRTVTVSDTWYGEHPGKWCRLCEAAVGKKHGYIYLGDDAAEAVYLRLEPVRLSTEVDEPEVERAITAAFNARRGDLEPGEAAEFFYEHGQWWVRATVSGRTWSVVDLNDDDFDFELVD